MMQVTTLLCD